MPPGNSMNALEAFSSVVADPGGRAADQTKNAGWILFYCDKCRLRADKGLFMVRTR